MTVVNARESIRRIRDATDPLRGPLAHARVDGYHIVPTDKWLDLLRAINAACRDVGIPEVGP